MTDDGGKKGCVIYTIHVSMIKKENSLNPTTVNFIECKNVNESTLQV